MYDICKERVSSTSRSTPFAVLTWLTVWSDWASQCADISGASVSNSTQWCPSY